MIALLKYLTVEQLALYQDHLIISPNDFGEAQAKANMRGREQGRAECESRLYKIDKDTIEGLLRDEREKVINEIIKFRDLENLDEYEVGNLNELIRRLKSTK